MSGAGPGEEQLAILIDADNISSKYITGLLAEVAKYGTASVRRIYGDWTSPTMRGWRECLLEHSLVPIQQFAYTVGKNATDGAMIIDAMDLLYTHRFTSFCIVSSDSDFTRLASRIRENGVKVYGFGSKRCLHCLVAACTNFTYLENLPDSPGMLSGLRRDKKRTRFSGSDNDGDFDMYQDLPRFHQQPDQGPQPVLQPSRMAMRHSDPQHKTIPATQPPEPSFRHASFPWQRESNAEDIPTFMSQSLPRAPRLQPEIAQRKLSEFATRSIMTAVLCCPTLEQDFVKLEDVGNYLFKLSSDLIPQNHGFQHLHDFVQASGIVEIQRRYKEGGQLLSLVRIMGY